MGSPGRARPPPSTTGGAPAPDTHGPAPAVRFHVAEHAQGPAVGQVDGVPAAQKVPPREQLLAGPRRWGRTRELMSGREPWQGGDGGRLHGRRGTLGLDRH